MLKFLLPSALKNKGNRNLAYTNNSSDYKSFPFFFLSFDFEYFSIILWHFEVKLGIVWMFKWILLRDFLCWMCVCHIREKKLEVTCVRLFAGVITRPRERKNRERGVMATWHRRSFFFCLLFVYIRTPSLLHTLGSQEDTDRSNRAPTRAPMVPTLFGSGTLQRWVY